MSKLKIGGVVAIAVILIGALLSFSVLIAVGFDFGKFNAESFERIEQTPEQPFSEIEIRTSFCDVRIMPAAQGETPRIITPNSKNIQHLVSLADGKLTVREVDAREWYEKIGIFSVDDEMVAVELYLPHAWYGNVKIMTASGDVSIEGKGAVEDLVTFQNVRVETASGDVDFHADVVRNITNNGNTVTGGAYFRSASGDIHVRGVKEGPISADSTSGEITVRDCTTVQLQLSSTSGDIKIANTDCALGSVNVDSTSGEITLSDVKADKLEMESSSGDMELTRVTVGWHMQLITVSGEIDIERSNAVTLYMRSTSGDIEAELLSGKRFFVETTSGDVRHPESDNVRGGLCEVKTTSGDVEITVLPQ